jgi:hypothetical protein
MGLYKLTKAHSSRPVFAFFLATSIPVRRKTELTELSSMALLPIDRKPEELRKIPCSAPREMRPSVVHSPPPAV